VRRLLEEPLFIRQVELDHRLRSAASWDDEPRDI